MKRSRSVALISMGLGGLALSACGQSSTRNTKPETGVFRSVKSCVNAGTYTQEQCEAYRADAISRHDEEFPSYDTLEQCEKVVGTNRCEQAPFSAPGRAYRPKFRAFIVADGKGMPVYPSSDNPREYRRGMTLIVWRGGSMASPATTAPKSGFASNKAPSTTGRGGFGSTGSTTGSSSS